MLFRQNNQKLPVQTILESTPGRYVGAEAVEDDDEAFAEKMLKLTEAWANKWQKVQNCDLENDFFPDFYCTVTFKWVGPLIFRLKLVKAGF